MRILDTGLYSDGEKEKGEEGKKEDEKKERKKVIIVKILNLLERCTGKEDQKEWEEEG